MKRSASGTDDAKPKRCLAEAKRLRRLGELLVKYGDDENLVGFAEVVAGGVTQRAQFGVGDFELGKVGVGMEHEALIDGRWSGHMHFFQLWVNLPGEKKFDPPYFQRAASARLPTVPMAADGSATCKVLHGEVKGKASPTKCNDVAWQYLDFELKPNASITHAPPAEWTTRLLHVYTGSVLVGADAAKAKRVDVGTVAFLDASSGNDLIVTAGGEGAGFMFVAGRPIRQPIVQHGPFVMSSQQQIMRCFQDFQSGNLCPQPVTYELYD